MTVGVHAPTLILLELCWSIAVDDVRRVSARVLIVVLLVTISIDIIN